MDTTRIDKENLQYFESLLLPRTTEKIRADVPVFALGAVDDGMACGALAGGPVGGTFYIEGLFVSPACRGRGAGTALINELVRIAGEIDELSELRAEYTISCEDHEMLDGFLQKHAFALRSVEDGVVSVPLDALAELDYFKTTQPACAVRPFTELTDNMLRALDKRLAAEGGALLEQPIDRAPLDRDCSMATMLGSAVDAFLLVERHSDRLISLAYADAGTGTGGGKVFSSMLISAYRIGVRKYPAGTRVLIQPVTPLSQTLVARLAPTARNLSRVAVRPLERGALPDETAPAAVPAADN